MNWIVFVSVLTGWTLAKLDTKYGTVAGSWLAEATKSLFR